MAYVVPERFQEMLSRGLELGENRIVAGMHSPLDVIGGRMQAQPSPRPTCMTRITPRSKPPRTRRRTPR